MQFSNQQKVRIKLKSYNSDIITESCEKIITTVTRAQAQVVGPVFFPTRRKIYCILRSPHVDKDSREHFEIKIYKRIIDIFFLSSQAIDLLMKLNIPAGVEVEIKI